MKSSLIFVGLIVCFVWSYELADLASDQAEARIIQEWSSCSEFCINSCKSRFRIEQYNLCFQYACGCEVLSQEQQELDISIEANNEETAETSTGTFLPTDSSQFEMNTSTSLLLMLSVGVVLVWIIGLIAWNSIKSNTKDEQPEYFVLDDNDHYQRLY